MPRDHKREECGPIFLQKKHILNIGDLVFFKGLECKKKIDCKVQSGFWGGLLVLKMFHFFDLRSRRESVTLEELAHMGNNGSWANIADRRPQFERPPSLGVCQDCRNEPFRMTDLG